MAKTITGLAQDMELLGPGVSFRDQVTATNWWTVVHPSGDSFAFVGVPDTSGPNPYDESTQARIFVPQIGSDTTLVQFPKPIEGDVGYELDRTVTEYGTSSSSWGVSEKNFPDRMAALLRPDSHVITQTAGRRLWEAADNEWGDRVELFSAAHKIAVRGVGLAVARIRVAGAGQVEGVSIEIIARGEQT